MQNSRLFFFASCGLTWHECAGDVPYRGALWYFQGPAVPGFEQVCCFRGGPESPLPTVQRLDPNDKFTSKALFVSFCFSLQICVVHSHHLCFKMCHVSLWGRNMYNCKAKMTEESLFQSSRWLPKSRGGRAVLTK